MLFPFIWDTKSNTLDVTKSKYSRVFSIIFFSYYPSYILFSACQLYRAVNDKSLNASVMDISWICMYGVAYYVAGEGVVGPFLKKYEQANLFRKIVNFDKILSGKLPSKFWLSRKWHYKRTICTPDLNVKDNAVRRLNAEKLAVLLSKSHVIGFFSLLFLIFIVIITKPKAAQFFYSVYPGHDFMSFMVFLSAEMFTRSINLAGMMLMQAWFILSVAFLTIGISTVRFVLLYLLFTYLSIFKN